MAEDDVGKVIGRGGRTVNALRTVIKAASVKQNARARRRDRSTERLGGVASGDRRPGRPRPRPRRQLQGGPAPRMSSVPGTMVTVAGAERRAQRAREPPASPSCASQGIADREAAEALRGEELLVGRGASAPLEEGEWLIERSRRLPRRGARRGQRGGHAGILLRRARGGGGAGAHPADLATRSTAIDTEGRRDRGQSRLPRAGGAGVKIDVFTLFPDWFGWFAEQRHVRNAIERGLTTRLPSTCARPRRSRAGGWTTRPTAAARAW